MDITVSANAVDQLRKIGLEEGRFLRLGVKPGGCAGTAYDAFIDSEKKPHDEIVYDQDGLKIVTEALYKHLFDGLTIDFSDDLIQPGFILKNPNAQESCGCGASFKTLDMTDPPCPTCGGCG
jgi:iron-sulfur cluster assembly protein